MIQIPPHTEPVQAASGVSQAAESQNTQPEKNGIGVFAKILAGLEKGLLRKTTAGESGTTDPALIPLAETTQTDKTSLVKGKKEKGLIEKNASTVPLETEAPEAARADGIAPDQVKALFAVEHLTTARADDSEQTRSAAASAGKASEGALFRDDGVITAAAADTRQHSRETLKTESPGTERIARTEAPQPEKLTSLPHTAVFAAAEAAGNPSTSPEKIKTRLNPVETSTKNGFIAGEYQRLEAKKTIPGEKDLDGRSRLDDARNRRRSIQGWRTSLAVQDFRTTTAVEGASRDGSFPLRVGADTRLSGDTSAREITLELRLPNTGQDSATATTSWEAKAGQALENMLARELHQNLNNDIVRHASIALHDGNEGTIRLALKPESLGNVKIHLELAENKIIGHIVVESEEALRAFQKEIASLEKAFRDSGFEAANLEMSLAADGRGAERQWQEAEASPFLPQRFAASRYDAALEQMEIPLTLDLYQQRAGAINVLA